MTLLQVIMILIQIESGGNVNAVGDGGDAIGCLQIHPVMVKECNRILGRGEFTLANRWSKRLSIQMAYIFLTHQWERYHKDHGEAPSALDLAVAWNTGSIYKDNRLYRRKVKLLLKQGR